MSIKHEIFVLLFLWMPDDARKFSLQFFRSFQNKKISILKGFRVQESGFRNPKSRLCVSIERLYDGGEPAVIRWLHKLTVDIFEPLVKETGNVLVYEQLDDEGATKFKELLDKSFEEKPDDVFFALCACLLETAWFEVHSLKERTPEKINAIYARHRRTLLNYIHSNSVLEKAFGKEAVAFITELLEKGEEELAKNAESVMPKDAKVNALTAAVEAALPASGAAPIVDAGGSQSQAAVETTASAANPKTAEVPEGQTATVESPAPEATGAQTPAVSSNPKDRTEANVGISKAGTPVLTREQIAATTAALVDLRAAKRPMPIPTVFPVANPAAGVEPPEPGRKRYVGDMRRASTFWNFFPSAVFENGQWRYISAEEAKILWPRFGGINIFMQKQQSFADCAVQILDLSDFDFIPIEIEGNKKDFLKRVDGELMRKNGHLRAATDLGCFPVVYPAPGTLDLSNRVDVVFSKPASEENLEADEERPAPTVPSILGTPVLLAVGDRFYGPFKLVEDGFGRPYVSTRLDAEEGLLKGFVVPEGVVPETIAITQQLRSHDGAESEVRFDVVFVSRLQAALFDLYDADVLVRRFGLAVGAGRKGRETVDAWLAKGTAENILFTEDERIRSSRMRRIKALIKRDDELQTFADEVGGLLAKYVAADEDDTLLKHAAAMIAADPAMLSLIRPYADIKSAIETVKTELKSERAALAAFEAQADAKRTAFREKLETENRALIDHVAQLNEIIAAKRSVIGNIVDCSDAIEMRSKLVEAAEAEKEKIEHYRAEVGKIDGYLKNAVQEAGRYAFDGMIAAKLQQAAADWAREETRDAFRTRAKAVERIPLSTLEGGRLADHLVRTVQAVRDYDRNTILSIYISLAQSFLTIFAGEPGTGKTSAAAIAAYALGLGGPNGSSDEERSRFLTVSVGRGWTSKRDFLGFYNTLSGRFESPDTRRTEAFRQLDEEAKAGFEGVPYLMLLDEANLSPMEFYWADFMNLADMHGSGISGSSRGAFISLGDGTRCAIPDTLRFIATINSDFTTESLSPRLIDRAAVLTLPTPDLRMLAAAEKPLHWSADRPVVDWQRFLALFAAAKPASASIIEKLEAVCGCYAQGGRPASPRTMRAMLRFASTAASLFESKDGMTAEQQALDRAVAQKLLPKINGSGEVYRRSLELLLGCCEDNGWRISAERLAAILARGAENMDDYGFF